MTDPARLLRDMFDAAVAAADPMAVLARHLPQRPRGRTVVVGAGKASARMAEALEAALDGGLSVTLHLAPARLAGRYAVALGLDWVEEDGTEVYPSLNPEGLEWAEALDRLHPITGWHVDIPAGQETLTLTVAPRHLEDARRTLAAGRPVRFEVRLQALMDEQGRVLARDLPSTAAQSRQSVRL